MALTVARSGPAASLRPMMLAPLFLNTRFDSLTVKGESRELRGRYNADLKAGFVVKEKNGEFSFQRVTYSRPPTPPKYEKERAMSPRDLNSLATELKRAGGSKNVSLAKAAELAAAPKGLLRAQENGPAYVQLGARIFEVVAETPEMKTALKAAAKKNAPGQLAELQGRISTMSDGRQVFLGTNITKVEALKRFSGDIQGKGAKTTVTYDIGGGKSETLSLKAMNDDVKKTLARGIDDYNPPPLIIGKKVGKTIEVWDINLAMHHRPM